MDSPAGASSHQSYCARPGTIFRIDVDQSRRRRRLIYSAEITETVEDMNDQSDNKPDIRVPAVRARTFLKGIVYYNNRGTSIECTIRDISDTGAKVEFSSLVTLPDLIELYIPQKQKTYQARVMRREPYEIGISFEDQRSGEARRGVDGELAERVVKLESELVSVNRHLKQLKAKIFPNEPT